MHKFLDRVIGPLVEARRPAVIVEVGAATGVNTRWLAAWAQRHDATFHCVDPKPAFDAEELAREHGRHFVMHRGLSLDVLPEIGPAEVVLLDGDHNWYTVFHELRAIDALNPGEWPLVLLHDVDWPYGRRDMYHYPATMPPEYRQPHRKAGMLKYRSALVEEGGKNAAFFNAEHEGGPRNGVLTAVEDFLVVRERDLWLLATRGPAGLGMLVSPAAAARYPQLADTLAAVHEPEFAISISPVFATRELPPLP
jgi:predicted O-methyltransferase YrrM